MKMHKKMQKVAAFALALTVVSVAGHAEEEKSGSFWDNTKVTGGIDINYNYNFNRPTTFTTPAPGGGTTLTTAANQYRTFDSNANSFNLSTVEIAIENTPADWVTFRTDLDFGRDAGIVAASENWGGGEIFNLQQAYVALKAPVGNGLTFKIGKFVTMHGSEVLEGWANNNVSRGLLFNYAIPYTHTGILASYPFADWVSFDFGIINGWNNVVDVNNGKSIHSMLMFKPTDKLSICLGGTVGPEAPGSDGRIRSLVDIVLNYTLNDRWNFSLNYDWARDSGINPGTKKGFADWQGFAAYANWKPYDNFGLTLRGEYFKDDVNFAGAAIASNKLFEGTLTSHWYVTDGLDVRFEYRHDHGNVASFVRGNGTARKFQDTLAAQVVYAF